MIFADTATTLSIPYYFVEIVVGLIVFGGVLGITWANFKNKNKAQAVKIDNNALTAAKSLIEVQKEQLENSKTEMKDLQDKHIQNQREIGELRGELKSLKEVPLRQISQALKQISDNQVLIAEHLGIDGFIKDVKK
jgi:predicted RNase H-like nuclease (RuvC/YqgF family)